MKRGFTLTLELYLKTEMKKKRKKEKTYLSLGRMLSDPLKPLQPGSPRARALPG
jgi:hypothetical protein